MKIEAKWCLWRDVFDSVEGIELLALDPIPVLKYYQENDDALFKKCPAYINYLKNTYVIFCPIDLKIEINKEENWANVIEPKKLPNIQFNPRFGEEGNSKYSIFSLRLNRILITTDEKDVYVEQTNPFLEWDSDNDIRVIPGNFNISKWIRPIEVAYEQKNKNLTIEFKRGQPLYYLRFITSNPDDIVVLNKTEMTKELYQEAKKCLMVKEFKQNSSLQFLYSLKDKFLK